MITTYTKTQPVGYVVSLAEAKQHLHVDDVTPGVAASVTLGSGNSQLKLAAVTDGAFANAWTVEVVEDGNNTALAVTRNGDALTVTLATDGSGNGTSTVNDVIAKIAADSDLTARFEATSGTGNGTGLLAAAAETSFAGGVDGTSEHDAYIEALLFAIDRQVETIIRGSLLPQTLVQLRDRFPCYGERDLILERGPVRSVTSVKYKDVDGVLQTMSSSLYSLHEKAAPAVISLEPDEIWPDVEAQRKNAVEVEYEAGYANAAAVPAPLKHAIKLILGHLFTNRESVVVGPGVGAIVIPQTVEWMLWPYRDFRF